MFSREERGRVYGLTSSATLLGQAIGPLLGGGIAAQFGIPAVFVVIGGLMAFNLAWVALAVRAPISEPS
jgi:DHA1 family multidrug resistance protein-like MFS transporter